MRVNFHINEKSKYIEATKRYYEELAEISKLTPQEETVRDLLLSISDEISKCFSVESHNPKSYDRLYTLLLSLMDTDLQSLKVTQLSLLGVNINGVISSAGNGKNNVLKRYILRYTNTPNARKELFDYAMEALSEQFQLDTHELSELLSTLLRSWAVVIGSVMAYTRTVTFITEKREKIKDKEEFYAIMLADETADIKIESFHNYVVDNGGNKDDIEIHNELMRIIDDLRMSFTHIKDGVTGIDFLEKLEETAMVFCLISIGNFLYNHDTYSQKWSTKEMEALDSIVYQPFMENYINELKKWVAEDKAKDGSPVEPSVKEIPSLVQEESKYRLSNGFCFKEKYVEDVADNEVINVLNNAIANNFISKELDEGKLKWNGSRVLCEYLLGLLFAKDYPEEQRKNQTIWRSGGALKSYWGEIIVIFNRNETKSKTDFGVTRRKYTSEGKCLPNGHKQIENLFSQSWREKYWHIETE